MRIVCATTNADRFRLIATLLSRLGHLAYMPQMDEIIVTEERGDIEDRALQKLSWLNQFDRCDKFDAALGIDDGIAIADQPVSPDSKLATNLILQGVCKPGTNIWIARAYALNDLHSDVVRVAVSRIPFTYVGDRMGKVGYPIGLPLLSVLAPFGGNLPIASMAYSATADYFDLHSGSALRSIVAGLQNAQPSLGVSNLG